MARWGYVYNNKLMGGSKMGMHIQSIEKLKNICVNWALLHSLVTRLKHVVNSLYFKICHVLVCILITLSVNDWDSISQEKIPTTI